MGDESPKNKVKFLCSYGGKLLPRSSDGVLKYVGGDTRVICVPRDVTLSEVMKKVSGIIDAEVILKYQLVPEDLDTLVTVRTEEDLKHMIQEHDRNGSVGGGGGAPLLRTFLFPSKTSTPPLPPIKLLEPPFYLSEQRFIDAINGITRTTSPRASSRSTTTTSYSACCSPKSNSPDDHTVVESPFLSSSPQMIMSQSQTSTCTGLTKMHKVKSSPSLSNLTNQHQPVPQDHHHHHHHHYHHFSNYPSASSSISTRQDSQLGMRRPSPIMIDSNNKMGFNYYYSNATRPHKPASSYAYHDDGRVVFERVHSVPRSPRNNTIWE